MYFRLLVGTHIEKGKTFSVERERDDKGSVVSIKQPIVESSVDLVMAFGPTKFQRLTEAEARMLLSAAPEKDAVGQDEKSPDFDPTASSETEVAKAANQGAAEIAKPPGKDVTDIFPMAIAAGMKVFRKKKGEYLVFDPQGKPVNNVPVTKEAVVAVVESQE